MDSSDVRRQWAERSGEYSPEYYAYLGPDDRSEAVCRLVSRFVDSEASILELGCSSGRHLSYLFDNGFEDLSGIEVNEDALDVLADHYPELASEGTFYLDAIESVVEGFDDGQFDVTYSVETLQHIHPDATWVFEEVARVTGDLLVTVENEGGPDQPQSSDPDVNYVKDEVPLYYRDWHDIFTDLGFTEVECIAGDRDTVRAFRPA